LILAFARKLTWFELTAISIALDTRVWGVIDAALAKSSVLKLTGDLVVEASLRAREPLFYFIDTREWLVHFWGAHCNGVQGRQGENNSIELHGG